MINSACLSLITEMVQLPPLSSSVIEKNKTNASETIIYLFIFLRKPNIILVRPAMHHSNGTVSTSNGYSGCSSQEGGGDRINKVLENAESTLERIRKKTFTKVEEYAGTEERLVIYLEIEEAPQDEIKDTLEHNNQSYVDWCDISDKEKNNNKVKITITYDMVWQKRSSGSIYEPSSGHAFIIDGINKGIIEMLIYQSSCWKFDSAENRVE